MRPQNLRPVPMLPDRKRGGEAACHGPAFSFDAIGGLPPQETGVTIDTSWKSALFTPVEGMVLGDEKTTLFADVGEGRTALYIAFYVFMSQVGGQSPPMGNIPHAGDIPGNMPLAIGVYDGACGGACDGDCGGDCGGDCDDDCGGDCDDRGDIPVL